MIESVAPSGGAIDVDDIPSPPVRPAPPERGDRRRGRHAVRRQGRRRQPRRVRPHDAGWAWLDNELTIERLRELLPETAALPIERFRYPKLRSLNFVIRGLLDEGVAASTRQDAQAKALGEWLRSRIVPIPESVLDAEPDI